jgi:polyisoprenoid-binding protein YceI
MQKKGQIFIILFILLIAIVGLFFLRITKPSEDTERANINPVRQIGDNIGFQGVRDPISITSSHISFEGFGPGKSHIGKFTNWNGELYIEKSNIVGFEGTIQANTVDTTIEKLDTHLKSDDFFDIEKYPTIEFESINLNNNQLSGDLTFLGTKKEINFPVIITDNSISADFVLDTKQFGKMSDLANSDVRIFFELFK